MTGKRIRTLLVIDDDELFCDTVSELYGEKHLEVLQAHSGREALKVSGDRKIDIILLDQKLPDCKGVSLCSALLERNDQAKIIFITAYPSLGNAVEAVKVGAHNYLSKPFEMEELSLAIEQSLRTLDLELVEQVQKYKRHKESEKTVLIGSKGGLREIGRLVDLAAANTAPVLITGETGTGKSHIAKAIHYQSSLKEAPFISINCAALPENLIEAELFGCEKGAFTGADTTRRGIFEMAEGGTLFFDEIGAMPLHLQSKLLGVLDERKIRRLGGTTFLPVEVRIIAATNVVLEEAIRRGSFREDVFYRLSVIRLHIPPLRERPWDLPELSRFFLHLIGKDSSLELSDGELERMAGYEWPGNVRELKNIIERSIVLQPKADLRPSELLTVSREAGRTRTPSPLVQATKEGMVPTLEEVEKAHIRHALATFSHNHSKAARALGISRSTLKRKIKTYLI